MGIEPKKLLHTSYYSALPGRPDVPENYANVIFRLSEKNGKTTLSVTQDNNETEKSRQHSENNSGKVLENLKKFLERNYSTNSQ